MPRAHYSSRSGSARNNGHIVRTAPGAPTPAQPKVPLADGLVECPVCHGGVRVVGLPYTDTDRGIRQGEKVYGQHRFGGTKGEHGRGSARCVGAYTRYVG